MTSQQSLIKFGFKFGKNGAHAAHTMMLAELQELFAYTPVDAGRDQYREQIVDFNRLDKPTSNTRVLTYGHLLDLYAMSPEVPPFRVFRTLWEQDSAARQVLALLLALARDPILRLSVGSIIELQPGQQLLREQMEAVLAAPIRCASIGARCSRCWPKRWRWARRERTTCTKRRSPPRAWLGRPSSSGSVINW